MDHFFSRLLMVFLWIVTAGSCVAEQSIDESLQSGSIVTVNDPDAIIKLQPYLEYWTPDTPVTIEDASNAANADKFQRTTSPAIAAIGREVWYRFTLQATPEFAPRMVLAFEQTKYQEVDIYTPSQSGWQVSRIGLARPYDKRPLEYRFLAAPLAVTANQPTTIYFRVLSLRGIAVAPLLETDTVFFVQSVQYSVLSGLIIGSLSALLIYVAMVSRLTLRGPQLFWLLGFIASCLFSTLYYDGYFVDTLEKNIRITEIIPFLIPGVLNVTAFMFCRHLFSMPKQMPQLNKVLSLLTGAYVIFSIAACMVPPNNIPPLITRILTTISLLSLLAISVRAISLKITGCYFYAIGILFYASGGAIISLSSIGFWTLPATGRLFLSGTGVLQTLFFALAALQLLSTMRQREQTLEKAALEANTRAEVQNGFLITMSHEIRTPINGVLGMVQMLEKTKLDSNQRYFLEILSDAGKTLLSVINEILDLSKIEADKLEIESIYFDVNHILLSIAGLFGQTCAQKQLGFTLNNDPELPLHLVGDPTRIQQVLNNLLANAAKFTDSGTITLSTKLMARLDNDAIVARFIIEDTGIGISEDAVKKLFLPFSQADKSTARHYGGTGLGLAICKKLVELMGGTIGVKSTVGKGSTFWFDLPLKVSVNEQRAFQNITRQLQNKRISWCVRTPKYVYDYNNSLLHWGAIVDFIDPDIDTTSINWKNIDLLIVSNALSHAQLIDWVTAAKQHGCHILLIESYGTTTDTGHAILNDILHLPRPAGQARLAEYLLKALANDANPHTSQSLINHSITGLHILVAEDNDVNIKVLQALFKKYSVIAEFCGNGQLAVDAYCKAPGNYDAIIMDCDMPVMDGFKASQLIRQFEDGHDFVPITIIALTAHALQETHEKCLASGMNDILTKPVNFPALLSLLSKLPRRSKPITIEAE